MYIKTKNALEEKLSVRREKKEEITEKTEIWIKEEFGIPDFYQLAKRELGIKLNGQPLGFLARHVASVKIEDIMTYTVSKKLGLEPVAGSFGIDQFSSINWSKKSCLRMPVLKCHGGKITTQDEYIVSRLEKLDGIPLKEIRTLSGESLIDFHMKLRKNTFRENVQVIDFSNFFLECFHISAENKKISPSLVVFQIQDKDGKQKKVKFGDISSLENIRPSMSWYYPLFFSLFVTDIVI